MDTQAPVTQLLADWRAGNEEALATLTPIIYETLRRLSKQHVGREQHVTLQATELLHEAYLNLVDVDVDWQDRAHFFAVASRLMRRLLIDRARHRLSQKRGGAMQMVTIDIDHIPSDQQNSDAESAEQQILELDAALECLKENDARKADVLELHFFGGMTYAEIAAALQISEATVDRDLRFAKAWIFNYVNPPTSD